LWYTQADKHAAAGGWTATDIILESITLQLADVLPCDCGVCGGPDCPNTMFVSSGRFQGLDTMLTHAEACRVCDLLGRVIRNQAFEMASRQ
jgi:hypothetical protein